MILHKHSHIYIEDCKNKKDQPGIYPKYDNSDNSLQVCTAGPVCRATVGFFRTALKPKCFLVPKVFLFKHIRGRMAAHLRWLRSGRRRSSDCTAGSERAVSCRKDGWVSHE